MQLIESIPKLKPRLTEAHKGDFGKVLIIAGSVGMSGAATLAGRAALRAGAGLVRVATAKSALPIVASIEPSYTTIPLAEDNSGKISSKAVGIILDAIAENDVVAFGPGVGVTADLQSIALILIEQNIRLVIDGDGLNNLSKIKNWPNMLKAELVLTPHPGEMKRLWSGLFREEMPSERQQQAEQFVQRTGTIVVLKVAGTIVTDGQKVYINKTGNPGMATASSGDVLTGVITALIGQGLSNLDAAVLGVYIHGLAGDIAAEKIGQVSLMATDIVQALSDSFIRFSKEANYGK
ncbi:MAG: NAD(P)H-hydrate dehydratase [Sedimentisphaerales bacterium]|nr:NAD(P)H-hydrate dehydratase [Sedimentisphaerales bacterium]